MAAAKKPVEPKPLELGVSYSFGFTRQIVQYEPVKCHISRSENWDVTGMEEAAISAHYQERFDVLKDEVMTLVNDQYEALGKS